MKGNYTPVWCNQEPHYQQINVARQEAKIGQHDMESTRNLNKTQK